jgi:hypothetical protein
MLENPLSHLAEAAEEYRRARIVDESTAVSGFSADSGCASLLHTCRGNREIPTSAPLLVSITGAR